MGNYAIAQHTIAVMWHHLHSRHSEIIFCEIMSPQVHENDEMQEMVYHTVGVSSVGVKHAWVGCGCHHV